MDCFWTWPGWTAVAAIATSVLALTIFAAIRQIEEARRSTNAQIAVSLFRELRSPEAVEMLRTIYALTPDDFKYSVKEEIGKKIDHVVYRFDLLGGLVRKGIIDEELAIESYAGAPALRCWYKLCKHYIRKVQDERGFYAENYEDFARRSLNYFRRGHFKKRHIHVFYRNGKEEPAIDLVIELQKEELHPRSMKEIERERKHNLTSRDGVN